MTSARPLVALAAALLAAALLACTPREPPSSVAATPATPTSVATPAVEETPASEPPVENASPTPPPAPDPSGPASEVDLGPIVGGLRHLTAPTAGRYASSIRGSQHRYITMEHDILHSIDGGASIELRPDGAVAACFWGTTLNVGKIGRYGSRDGKDHRNESGSTFRLGARGTWAIDDAGSGAIVRLQTFAWNRCDPTEESWERAMELQCHALAAGGGLPTPAIVCRLPDEPLRLDDVAMVLEPNPRAGPWILRQDLSGRGPEALGPEVRPWLLLGAPGLSIRSEDRDEGAAVAVTLAAAEVPTPAGSIPPAGARKSP